MHAKLMSAGSIAHRLDHVASVVDEMSTPATAALGTSVDPDVSFSTTDSP